MFRMEITNRACAIVAMILDKGNVLSDQDIHRLQHEYEECARVMKKMDVGPNAPWCSLWDMYCSDNNLSTYHGFSDFILQRNEHLS